uniref:Protein arginine methyltransferase NDUFAF7 n=1 Tax=Arcella intermedia TaxID=1963864 RepID=A0A6B2L524_9EUKA
MTPVEIFKPYYAEALGKHIVKQVGKEVFSASDPFHLLEIGGGNGTCMQGILDFLALHHPGLYAHTVCTMVDVSAPFLEAQRRTLAGHAGKVSFHLRSVLDWAEPNPRRGFVLAMELLDNLPHDKLVLKSTGLLQEAWVHRDPTSGAFLEKHKELSDPVLLSYLRNLSHFYKLPPDCFLKPSFSLYHNLILWSLLNDPLEPFPSTLRERLCNFAFRKKAELLGSSMTSSHTICYVPTGSFLLLKQLKEYFPRHGLLFADFNQLSETLSGTNAPLVQKTEGEESVVKDSYLDTQGEYDIFFPTNFLNLRILYQTVYGSRRAFVCSSKDFMKENADWRKTRTRLGFNPLLSDYVNTSFFISPME